MYRYIDNVYVLSCLVLSCLKHNRFEEFHKNEKLKHSLLLCSISISLPLSLSNKLCTINFIVGKIACSVVAREGVIERGFCFRGVCVRQQ